MFFHSQILLIFCDLCRCASSSSCCNRMASRSSWKHSCAVGISDLLRSSHDAQTKTGNIEYMRCIYIYIQTHIKYINHMLSHVHICSHCLSHHFFRDFNLSAWRLKRDYAWLTWRSNFWATKRLPDKIQLALALHHAITHLQKEAQGLPRLDGLRTLQDSLH